MIKSIGNRLKENLVRPSKFILIFTIFAFVLTTTLMWVSPKEDTSIWYRALLSLGGSGFIIACMNSLIKRAKEQKTS